MSHESSDEHAWYLYGVVGADAEGLAEALPKASVAPPEPVRLLTCEGLQALVSLVPLTEFGTEQLPESLHDLEWLAAKVSAHEHVLEAVLPLGPVVPMRFCTIYHTATCVREALAAHHDEFVQALAHLAGQSEWGVKVYSDRAALAQGLGEVSDLVKQLRADLLTKPAGAAYFVEKRLEHAIATEVERLADECAQSSHDLLASHAAEAGLNPLQSPEIAGRPEPMILNGAYLVAETQLPAFRNQLATLQQQYGPLGFSYDLTGPWPPYNFVSLGAEEEVPDDSVTG